ncbi:hypothetical protein ACFL0Y_01115 [Patescibacteria group bacterium]
MPEIYTAPKKKAKSKTKTSVERAPARFFHHPTYKAKIEKIIRPEQRNKSHWSSFVAQPKTLNFETQERKERVILLLRRHFITNLSWILTTLALVMAPFLFLNYFPFELPFRYRLIIALVWWLASFAFAFEKFLSWLFNVNIITDERIIDIDFPSLLYKDISETKLDQIQDVSIRVGGFTRSLFNFGDVAIQTAGPKVEIYFEAILNPEQVSKVLNELVLEEEQEKLEGRVR